MGDLAAERDERENRPSAFTVQHAGNRTWNFHPGNFPSSLTPSVIPWRGLKTDQGAPSLLRPELMPLEAGAGWIADRDRVRAGLWGDGD